MRVLINCYNYFYTVLGWPGLLPLDTSGPCMRPRCCTSLVSDHYAAAGHHKSLGVLLLYVVLPAVRVAGRTGLQRVVYPA